jgi:exoribonuclease II
MMIFNNVCAKILFTVHGIINKPDGFEKKKIKNVTDFLVIKMQQFVCSMYYLL